jgi:hypothetical protein
MKSADDSGTCVRGIVVADDENADTVRIPLRRTAAMAAAMRQDRAMMDLNEVL